MKLQEAAPHPATCCSIYTMSKHVYTIMAATTYYHGNDHIIIALSPCLVFQIVGKNISESIIGFEIILISFREASLPETMPKKDTHNDRNWSQSKKSATEINTRNDAEKGCP